MSSDVLLSTKDGMGFEEVNQPSSTEMISGTNLYGTTISGGQVRFEDVVVNDDLSARVISENNNQLYSTSIQNATELFGRQVKAGSLTMGPVGYSGLIQFVDGGSFTSANYFITISARNWSLPMAAVESGTSFGISGIRRASGCWAYGPSGTEADWIAVGI